MYGGGGGRGRGCGSGRGRADGGAAVVGARGVVLVERLLRLRRGIAVGLHADGLLEIAHGHVGIVAIDAVGRAVQPAQLDEPLLQQVDVVDVAVLLVQQLVFGDDVGVRLGHVHLAQRRGLVFRQAEHLVERHQPVALLRGVGDEAQQLAKVVVRGVEQVDVARRELALQFGHAGGGTAQRPVRHAVVAHLFHVLVGAQIVAVVAAARAHEVHLVIDAQRLADGAVVHVDLPRHLVGGHAVEGRVGVGVVFQLHAVFVGVADDLPEALALEVFADGQYGQFAAVVDGALHDLAQILRLVAVVHGDGDDLLRGLPLGEHGQIALRLRRGDGGGNDAVVFPGGALYDLRGGGGGAGLRSLRGLTVLRSRVGLRGVRLGRVRRGRRRGKGLRGRGLRLRPCRNGFIPAARGAAGDDDGQSDDQQRGQSDGNERQRRAIAARAAPCRRGTAHGAFVPGNHMYLLPSPWVRFPLDAPRTAQVPKNASMRQNAGAGRCFHVL